jgi:hypothetical protein
MKHLNKLAVLFVATILLFASCKKDDPKTDDNNNNGGAKTCLPLSVKDSGSFDFKFFYTNNLKTRVEQYYFNAPDGWKMDGSLSFEYNANKQLTKFINRFSSNYTESLELLYTNNRVSSFDAYDSSETGEREYSYTVNYEYNANGKISKWVALDKSDPTNPFAEVNLSYDANGGIKEIIIYEPDMDGKMIPGAKYVLNNDNQKLIDPYIPALFMEAELFYMLFNQENMKQPNLINAYYFNEDDETWVLDGSNMIQNTYDAEGKLTKMVIDDENYTVTWDCK